MSYLSGMRQTYCHKCDKKGSSLCGGCMRVSINNRDNVPIGYNKNYIEPICDEY